MGELEDLVVSDWHTGPEVFEDDVGPDTRQLLSRLAPGIRASLARTGKLLDCWWAVPAWERSLRSEMAVHVCSEPDPDDQLRADYGRMAEFERGGYEIDGGLIKRHVWLAIGPRLALFDPTAHQFDGCGRPSLRRYWRQHPGGRIPFTAWRALRLSRPL